MTLANASPRKIKLTARWLLLLLLSSALSSIPAAAKPIHASAEMSEGIHLLNTTYLPLVIHMTYPPTKIYCMGDSLTSAGVYETVLSDLLGSGWAIINKGHSGHTTTDMLARFQADIIDPGDATYVIIWGGTVDVFIDDTQNTTANLQSMYDMAHNAGIKVVAVTIPPQNDASAQKKAKIVAINAWMKNNAVNVDYVADAYTAVDDPAHPGNILPAYDLGDHMHLSNAGYTVVAYTIYNAVTWIPNPRP